MFKTFPPWFNLSSLKSLHLLSTSSWKHKYVESLLRFCPVLEDLVVNQIRMFGSNAITCRTLKTLILRDLSISLVPPSFCMPSLKAMQLLSVKFSGGESVASLLQMCPLLEDLVVNQTEAFESNECTMSSCRTLKTLTLSELSIKVVQPWFRLPSLKTLHLLSVKFSGEESIESFLPVCPVLECLVVDQTKDDCVMFEDVPVWFCLPSLKSLHLLSVNFSGGESLSKLIQRCPVLEDLVICGPSKNFIGSLTSETPYPTFPYLEHLEICMCSASWASLLVCILEDAPSIKYLKLKSQPGAHYYDPMILWKPKVIPECLSTHLEIMEWRQYEGREQERNVAAYVLANATSLKMATFSTRCRNKQHIMLRELTKLNRGSETCQLLFD